MALGDILEVLGGSIDPQAASHPDMPAAGSILTGALSGFSAGRAARRRLAASSRIQRLEERLGFPVDVLHRLSQDAQMSILRRAGFGEDDGLDNPLPQYEGRSMRQLMREGAPAVTTAPPEGTGIFAGIAGGEASSLSGASLPQTRPAVPPLSMVAKTDVPGLLDARFGSGVPTQSPLDAARTRAATALAEGREYNNQNILPLQKENLGLQGKATQALTTSRIIRTQLARDASLGAVAPSWLVSQLRLGGIKLPADQPVTFRALNAAMANAGGWQELQATIDQRANEFIQQVEEGHPVTKRDIQEYADQVLGGKLTGLSLQFSKNERLARDLFVQRVWDIVRTAQSSRDRSTIDTAETPFSLTEDNSEE